MLRPLLVLVSAVLLSSCASLQAAREQLSPENCALRLSQSQTLEDAVKVLSEGGLAPGPVQVILQAIVDGRTTLDIACQIANDPEAVAEINSGTPSPEPVPQI